MKAFGELLSRIEYAMAHGVLRRGDVVEIAQQIWSMSHGAMALELHDLVLSDDAAVTYEALMETCIRGFAP
jgi:hypothetical protein